MCVVEPEHLEGQQKIHLKPQCRLFISAKVCVLLCSLSRNPERAAESSHKKVVSTLNLAIKAGVLNPKPMKGRRKSPKTAMSSFHSKSKSMCIQPKSHEGIEGQQKIHLKDQCCLFKSAAKTRVVEPKPQEGQLEVHIKQKCRLFISANKTCV